MTQRPQAPTLGLDSPSSLRVHTTGADREMAFFANESPKLQRTGRSKDQETATEIISGVWGKS
jgi:hypothetical protein